MPLRSPTSAVACEARQSPDLLEYLAKFDDIMASLDRRRIGREHRQSIARKGVATKYQRRFEGVRK